MRKGISYILYSPLKEEKASGTKILVRNNKTYSFRQRRNGSAFYKSDVAG
jgi:hypothetical protein